MRGGNEILESSSARQATLRERQADQLRHELRMHFVRLVVERGAEGFSFQEVASAAGIATRTLYRYFPNREAIIESIRESEIATLDREILGRAGSLTSFEVDPDLVATLFEVLDRHALLLQAGKRLGATGFDGRTSDGRTSAMRDLLARTGGIHPAVVAQLTGLVRLLLSSDACLRLRQPDIGLDAREAGYAAHWAVQTLIRAAGGLDGPLRPSVTGERR
jgi:AcrR family transcriptional regulator